MTENCPPQEIEVKFHLDNPEEMVNLLLSRGAKYRRKVFESNLCFDDPDGRLRRAGQLLRLREDDRCRLTFKGNASPETDYKVFDELETEVSDCGAMRAILEALGFRPVQIYEKWRQTFFWLDVTLCMDTLPFGHFLEIEGSRQAIRHAADALGLPWNQRIVWNYLAIFEYLRKMRDLPFTDVTFTHFDRHPVDITPFLQTLRTQLP